jgi:hypothetical protein
MIATIETYGVKHSFETKHDHLDSDEFCALMFKLMLMAGFHKDNLIDSLQEIINDEKKCKI